LSILFGHPEGSKKEACRNHRAKSPERYLPSVAGHELSLWPVMIENTDDGAGYACSKIDEAERMREGGLDPP
jgi:hypothetical protein